MILYIMRLDAKVNFDSKVGPRHEMRRPLYDLGPTQHEEKRKDWPRKDAEQRS